MGVRVIVLAVLLGAASADWRADNDLFTRSLGQSSHQNFFGNILNGNLSKQIASAACKGKVVLDLKNCLDAARQKSGGEQEAAAEACQAAETAGMAKCSRRLSKVKSERHELTEGHQTLSPCVLQAESNFKTCLHETIRNNYLNDPNGGSAVHEAGVKCSTAMQEEISKCSKNRSLFNIFGNPSCVSDAKNAMDGCMGSNKNLASPEGKKCLDAYMSRVTKCRRRLSTVSRDQQITCIKDYLYNYLPICKDLARTTLYLMHDDNDNLCSDINSKVIDSCGNGVNPKTFLEPILSEKYYHGGFCDMSSEASRLFCQLRHWMDDTLTIGVMPQDCTDLYNRTEKVCNGRRLLRGVKGGVSDESYKAAHETFAECRHNASLLPDGSEAEKDIKARILSNCERSWRNAVKVN